MVKLTVCYGKSPFIIGRSTINGLLNNSILVGQGLLNVLIEHHPKIGDIISNRYLKVMFKIPKVAHLPSPVGGFNNLEKYEFVNGKDDIPYMKWKIKMFETTNQNITS